jgi:hypothetical protein
MAHSQVPDDSDKPHGKRHGCLLSFACFFAIVVLAVSLGYFAWYSSARGELDSEIAKIRERGEPLWFHELAPQDVDSEQDATPLFLLALAKRQRPTQAFYDLVGAEPPTPPGDYPALVAVLSGNDESLALLRQATRRPHFRLPLDFETKQPISLTLDPIQDSRDFARILLGQVLQSLGTGENQKALDAIEDMFGLSELLRDEPFIITQLVRIAIGAVGQGSMKQVVAAIDLTPEQFTALDDQLAAIETRFGLAHSIRSERAMAFTTMSFLSENLDSLNNAGVPGGESSGLGVLSSGILRPNMMADQAFMLRTLSDYVDVVDMTGTAGRDAADGYDEAVRNASKRYILSKLLMPALLHTREAGLRYRMKLVTVRLGLRVDRYYAEHGTFPASLAEILDDKITAVPVDLYTSKPLVYKLLPDGFTIYPVGSDGIDNGGGMQPDNQEFYGGFDVHYPQLAPKAADASKSLPAQK